ncbi:MAG: phosphopantetheine-binding protein [Bacillota bacterium]
MSVNIIEVTIEECLREVLRPGVTFSQDIDLVPLGLDSINFIRLVILLEEKFEIELPDELIVLDQFSTVSKIATILNQILE